MFILMFGQFFKILKASLSNTIKRNECLYVIRVSVCYDGVAFKVSSTGRRRILLVNRVQNHLILLLYVTKLHLNVLDNTKVITKEK